MNLLSQIDFYRIINPNIFYKITRIEADVNMSMSDEEKMLIISYGTGIFVFIMMIVGLTTDLGGSFQFAILVVAAVIGGIGFLIAIVNFFEEKLQFSRTIRLIPVVLNGAVALTCFIVALVLG